jgi:hypothetical protein
MAVAEMLGLREVRASVALHEAPRHQQRELDRERERARERLTPGEARLVRYVLSEWSGDAQGGSRWAEMIQAEEAAAAVQERARAADAAALDVEALILGRARKRALKLALKYPGRSRIELRREAWARQDERLEAYCQTMHVKSSGSMSKLGAADQHGYPLLEGPEAWVARGRKAAGEIVRAWRAVCALDRRAPALAVVLVRLHGNALPGDRGVNPFAKSYAADLAREYALVAECAGLGSWAELARSIGRKRKGETSEVVAARSALLREAAARSERLIVGATRGYREEWGRAEG